MDGNASMSVGTTAPESTYAVVYHKQTIGGVTYREAESPLFNLLTDVEVNLTLTPAEEEPPPPAPGEAPPPWILVPQAAAALALLLLG